MNAIQSPCILICAIDDQTGLCFGCGRSQQEIGAWSLYSHDQRQTIMDALPARMETIEQKPRRKTRRQIIEEERQARKAAAANGGNA